MAEDIEYIGFGSNTTRKRRPPASARGVLAKAFVGTRVNYTAVGFWGNKWKRVRGRERERSSVPMGDSQCPKSTVTDRNFSSSFLFSFADARQEFVFGREQQQRLLAGPALGNTLSRKYVDTRREHYRGFGKQDEDACRLLPRALLDTSHGYLCFCEWRVRL